MTAAIFSFRRRPGSLPLSPPKDDPAWIYVQSAHSDTLSESAYKPTREEWLLAAHHIAAEVRERRGMKVMKTVMAKWTETN